MVAQREGWCGFCRQFASDGGPLLGGVTIYRLRGQGTDRSVQPCEPAALGNWESTGHEPVAYSSVRLRFGRQAMPKTMFLCVDYWPLGLPDPLLFETVLVHLQTGREFDQVTQRYATHAEAAAGHRAILARLALPAAHR